MGGFYMAYLESLCRRRGWRDPLYETYRSSSGFTCLVLVNGREYQTDLAYESDGLAQENAAMRAFMVCRNFSVNGELAVKHTGRTFRPPNDILHVSEETCSTLRQSNDELRPRQNSDNALKNCLTISRLDLNDDLTTMTNDFPSTTFQPPRHGRGMGKIAPAAGDQRQLDPTYCPYRGCL
ncbi:hypothetical protein BKA64DRAFT_3137 [Cadophora sp. MPI-SDFR-AT-0126]|nr:hypothetical protein BKA64DRAFT_3137 [Leotiomycetes sp. MPI-SDFR-AT-0126]